MAIDPSTMVLPNSSYAKPASLTTRPSQARMACVHLPHFILQIAGQQNPLFKETPSVVLTLPETKGKVLACNRLASAEGITVGMRYAEAISLAPNVQAVAVSELPLTANLDALAKKLHLHSPSVEIAEQPLGVFWLSAQGLLNLYGSLEAWAQKVHSVCTEAGYSARIVVGFQRFFSYLVACRPLKKPRPIFILRDAEMEEALVKSLPLEHCQLSDKARMLCQELGITTIGGFAALPQTGIARRFGPHALAVHQLLSGYKQDIFSPHTFTIEHVSSLHFDNDEDNTERLGFALKRCLDQLLRDVQKRALFLQRIVFWLHARDSATQKEICPARPMGDALSWMLLIRLALEKIDLQNGITSVRVQGFVTESAPMQLLLLDKPKREEFEKLRALDKLRALYGTSAVTTAQLCDEFLPEKSFSLVPALAHKRTKPAKLAHAEGAEDSKILRLPRYVLQKPTCLPAPVINRNDGVLILGSQAGSVARLFGPYAISRMVWDDPEHTIHRDYYYAETVKGGLYWVFFDHLQKRWFCQGNVG